jgi:His/Glu/Gln/Arg/opine family amino acid ABC transporter permease subunit
MHFDVALAWESLPQLLRGTGMTLGLLLPVLLLGPMLAVPLALMQLRGGWRGRFATAYVGFFRGVPSLILLYVIYNGLPQFGFIRNGPLWPLFANAYVCAVMGLSLTHSAYLTEIVRAGLEAVSPSIVEAARSLGMGPRLIFWKLRLPLALRYTLRAYQNEVLVRIKNTAAVSAITVVDLTAAASEVFEVTYDPFTPLVSAAILYWLFINATRFGFDVMDRRLNAHTGAYLA